MASSPPNSLLARMIIPILLANPREELLGDGTLKSGVNLAHELVDRAYESFGVH